MTKKKIEIGDICKDCPNPITEENKSIVSVKNDIEKLRNKCRPCYNKYQLSFRQTKEKENICNKCEKPLTEENTHYKKYKTKDGTEKLGKTYTCYPCTLEYNRERNRKIKEKTYVKPKPKKATSKKEVKKQAPKKTPPKKPKKVEVIKEEPKLFEEKKPERKLTTIEKIEKMAKEQKAREAKSKELSDSEKMIQAHLKKGKVTSHIKPFDNKIEPYSGTLEPTNIITRRR